MTIIPLVSLQGDSHHYFELDEDSTFSHLRFNLYPDVGVVRLRVYGQVQCNWENKDKSQTYDLVAVEQGGRAIAWNDKHFGCAANLLAPCRGVNMVDGWETHRRREPRNGWCMIELGHPCIIDEVIVDTAHFKGNYPDH